MRTTDFLHLSYASGSYQGQNYALAGEAAFNSRRSEQSAVEDMRYIVGQFPGIFMVVNGQKVLGPNSFPSILLFMAKSFWMQVEG